MVAVATEAVGSSFCEDVCDRFDLTVVVVIEADWDEVVLGEAFDGPDAVIDLCKLAVNLVGGELGQLGCLGYGAEHDCSGSGEVDSHS